MVGLSHVVATFLAASLAAAEQVFEDSAALTTLWQASSSGQTEMFISQIIQNRDFAQHRAADGRGPVFWAYEFKNVDTLALLMHLGVTLEQEDLDGKAPREFFSDGPDALAEFEADAKSKIEELAAMLTEREEEFYSYQHDPDDYDDEAEPAESAAPKAPAKSKVDTIDYADDEDEDYEDKDEM
jgi:hypothetical protein